MSRILFMANAPWCTTGYGVQGKHLTPRLKAMGHEVAYFAFYGLQNGVLTHSGVPIYPAGLDVWGADILPAHMAHFGADTLITLLDVWVTDNFSKLAQTYGWRWLPWTPIDSEPVATKVLDNLDGCHTVMAYSQYGIEQLRQAGIGNVAYAPHGVSDVYRPGNQAAARKRLGLDDNLFILGMVAANQAMPSRKAFPEQLAAFARFHRNHPRSLMYLHTFVGPQRGGVDIEALARRLGILDAVRWSNQYQYTLGFEEADMAMLFQAFDLLSLVSMNEGFGLPLIEAQACGTPVVTLARTSMRELCFGGMLVDKAQPFWTPLNNWAFMPDIGAIWEAYEQMYEALQEPETAGRLRAQATAGASAYRWDRAAEYWRPVLDNGGTTHE